MTPKRTRPKKGNVIYANFGAHRKISTDTDSARIVQIGRGQGDAAKWLANLIQTRAESGRAKRGLGYYRAGHVLNFSAGAGRITANVMGSQNIPFEVSLSFPHRVPEDFQAVASLIAADANGIGRIKGGTLGPDLLRLLLADAPEGVRLWCSCPDPEECCKHVVAVAHQGIDQFDADPNLVFQLRSTSIAEFEQTTLLLAKKISVTHATDSPDAFWSGGQLPPLPTPKTQSALEDSDLHLLHNAIRVISYSSVDELRGVADLEDLYDYLTHDR